MSSRSFGEFLIRFLAAQLCVGVLASTASADDSSHPTYYAQWGGGGKTNVCIHYTTPPGINPWIDGGITYPTRVDGAIGTPNYSLPIVCGGDGAAGQNASNPEARGSTGGYAGYVPLPITATLTNNTLGYNHSPAVTDAIVYITMGGWGGGGGDADRAYSASTGGTGAKGGDLNITFKPGSQASITTSSAAIFAQSIGGSGGNGGEGGGNGGIAGPGGSVIVTNGVGLYSSGYGIFAQSLGGWGGTGTDGNSAEFTGTNGGTGSAGASGGPVFVTNTAVVQAPAYIPIYAQSIGGNGGNGGSGNGGYFGTGSAGSGGYGGPGGAVWVNNSGNLYSAMTGGYGIFAQSVGGGGGNAGATAGLTTIGATGGVAASGGGIIVANTNVIAPAADALREQPHRRDPRRWGCSRKASAAGAAPAAWRQAR